MSWGRSQSRSWSWSWAPDGPSIAVSVNGCSLQSWTKYFAPEVISYVFVVYLGLLSSPLPLFNVVLFEKCSPFTSIFNIENGGGGI